jgi:hypothetical protein
LSDLCCEALQGSTIQQDVSLTFPGDLRLLPCHLFTACKNKNFRIRRIAMKQ